MNIQCYHYDLFMERVTSIKNGEYVETTIPRYIRVNSHFASEPFQFDKWEDRSTPENIKDIIHSHKVSRLHTNKVVELSPEAIKKYRS